MKINSPVSLVLAIAILAAAGLGVSKLVYVREHLITPKPAAAEPASHFIKSDKLADNYGKKITPEDIKPLPVVNGKSFEVPILMYHHVGSLPENPDGTRRDLTVSTEDFTREVSWLKSSGYNSVSLEQVLLAAKGQGRLPAKPIVFTFDDGYDDVFDNAVPVLLANGYTGTFAVITQFAGNPGYATWDQIRAAQKSGMEIVSHTRDHFDGSNTKKYDGAFMYEDLVGSRGDLERELGSASEILIYPYGHYSAPYLEAAKKAGFVMGLTVHFGMEINPDDLMEVPRVRVHGKEDFEVFKKILLEHWVTLPPSESPHSATVPANP